MKKVLVLSYLYPPVGGAGVQRAAKFTKFLPELDWQPIVLTVSNPSVLIFDESLTKEIPDSVDIRKAKTLEPGYAVKNSVSAATEAQQSFSPTRALKSFLRAVANFLLQPDPQILWYPAAVKEGMRILQSEQVDAIYATGPPFSSFVLGARLSRKSGVPLVLDYRDEWDISNAVWENKKISRFSLFIQRRQQKSAIKQAAALIATTQQSADALQKISDSMPNGPDAHTLYNGYDPEDFESGSMVPSRYPKSQDKYRICYIGTLWNLTSVEPLVQALQLLNSQHPELAEKIEFLVAGRTTAEQQAFLNRLDSTNITLTNLDYVDHAQAVTLMQEADELCLLLTDLEVAGRVVPAKIFEYFACRRPILAIAPEGEVWRLLADYPAAFRCLPSKSEEVAAHLAKAIGTFQSRRGETSSLIEFDSSKFDRRQQTVALAEILTSISSRNFDT